MRRQSLPFTQGAKHDLPDRFFPFALGLRLSTPAAPVDAACEEFQGRGGRGTGPSRGPGAPRTHQQGHESGAAGAAHTGRCARLSRRPVVGPAATACGLFAGPQHRRLPDLVLHTDGLAVDDSTAPARHRLRLHGRAGGVQERAAPAAPTRDCAAAHRRPRVDRWPGLVPIEGRLELERALPAQLGGRGAFRPRRSRCRQPRRRARACPARTDGAAAAGVLRRHRRAV